MVFHIYFPKFFGKTRKKIRKKLSEKIVKKMLTIRTIGVILLKQSQERTVFYCQKRHYGVLAQLGEHLPYKQRVTGSSPVGPIYLAEQLSWLEHAVHTRGVVGSSPISAMKQSIHRKMGTLFLCILLFCFCIFHISSIFEFPFFA